MRLTAVQAAPVELDLNELARRAGRIVAQGTPTSFRVLACRWKGKKVVVEFETTAASGEGVIRCIGKTYKEERASNVFRLQSELWNSGFCPPSPYTVAQPIALLSDCNLFLQEAAPGRPAIDCILGNDASACSRAVELAAYWINALQRVRISANSRLEKVKADWGRFSRDLEELLPHQAPRIRHIVGVAESRLGDASISSLVLSHGDLHPKNLFVSEDGRATAIDLDTLGMHERSADAGYFLAQTAVMGYFRNGSFSRTAEARREFLSIYAEVSEKDFDDCRLALYCGMALVQSLHYELCVWRNGRTHLVNAWLSRAASCVLDSSLEM